MALPSEYEIITSVWEVFTAKSTQWTLNREVVLNGASIGIVMNITVSDDGERVFVQDEDGHTVVDLPYGAVALERRRVKREMPPEQ